jgi:hypothetical protein
MKSIVTQIGFRVGGLGIVPITVVFKNDGT